MECRSRICDEDGETIGDWQRRGEFAHQRCPECLRLLATSGMVSELDIMNRTRILQLAKYTGLEIVESSSVTVWLRGARLVEGTPYLHRRGGGSSSVIALKNEVVSLITRADMTLAWYQSEEMRDWSPYLTVTLRMRAFRARC